MLYRSRKSAYALIASSRLSVSGSCLVSSFGAPSSVRQWLVPAALGEDDGDEKEDEEDDDDEGGSTRAKTTYETRYEIRQVTKTVTVTPPEYRTDTDGDGLVDAIDPDPAIRQQEYFTDTDGDSVANAFDRHHDEDDFAYSEINSDADGNGIVDAYEGR